MNEEKTQVDRATSEVNVEAVVIPPLTKELMIALGFEKTPDGMYYERGYEHKGLNIVFDKPPTLQEFWIKIANTYSNRAIQQFKQEIKDLLF